MAALGAAAALAFTLSHGTRADAQDKPMASSTLYAVQCASCHGARMEGGQFGPALKSDTFASKWHGKRTELQQFIRRNMPPAAAGQLSEADAATLTGLLVGANRLDQAGGVAPAKERVGYLGVRPPPFEAFHDREYARAMAAQEARLVRLTPVTAQMLRSPAPGDWLTWRRGQDLTGFSPLTEITPATAPRLQLKWAWSMKAGSNEQVPLVHDGVMFVQSGEEVQALDAANGTLLWRYVRDVPESDRGLYNRIERTIALFGDMVFAATPDRHVVALDAKSGKLVWDTEVVPRSETGVYLTAGPFIAGKALVVPLSMGVACKGGCYVTGLDPATGRKLWRFDTVAKTGPAGDTWNGLPPEERSGGAGWTAGSYDPDLDLLYFGTGGTYDVSSLLDPHADGTVSNADALYTDTTLALRPGTGDLAWYHQHLARDVWDYDEVFERTLATLPVDGRDAQAVITIGKLGILDALDRKTGRYLFSYDLGLQDVVTAIDPKTGRRTINPAKVLQRDKPVVLCPGAEGVRNWLATSWDAARNILYVPMIETCMEEVRSVGDDGVDGKLDLGWRYVARPGSDGKLGRIQAIDLVARKPLWTVRTRAIPASGLVLTAGGVLFSGDSDRWFRAIDSRTGATLWQTRLNAQPSSNPVSFEVDGHQYVAIIAGGGGGHDQSSPSILPEEAQAAPTTTVWVFGL
jgi:alcohol dehydrogenase (cytochrome c)